MIYLASALFAAGSLIAALANNFTVVLVGRTIQGVGGGGLIALTEVQYPLSFSYFRSHVIHIVSN